MTDDYTWTEDDSCMYISLLLPYGTHSSEVLVTADDQTLTILLGNKPIMGKLRALIKPNETVWLIMDSSALEITLFKKNFHIWGSLFEKNDCLNEIEMIDTTPLEYIETGLYLVEKMSHASCYYVYILFPEGEEIKVEKNSNVEMLVSSNCMQVTVHCKINQLNYSYNISFDVPISITDAFSQYEKDHVYIKLPFLRLGDSSGTFREESLIDMGEIDLASKDYSLELVCRNCNQQISNGNNIKSMFILPSDHWGDMMDSMFCHLPTDPLPIDSIGSSIFRSRLSKGIKGRGGIKETSFLLHKDDLNMKSLVYQSNSIMNNITSDVVNGVYCSNCNSTLGYNTHGDDSDDYTNVFLYKHCLQTMKPNVILSKYSYDLFLSSTLMHFIQSQNAYRFLLYSTVSKRKENEEGGLEEEPSLAMKIVVINNDICYSSNSFVFKTCMKLRYLTYSCENNCLKNCACSDEAIIWGGKFNAVSLYFSLEEINHFIHSLEEGKKLFPFSLQSFSGMDLSFVKI